MRKIFLIFMIALMMPVVGLRASDVVDGKLYEVLAEYCPELKAYVDAGVVSIESVVEEDLFDGDVRYDIRYRYVRNFYEGEELADVLREAYPEVYGMWRTGVIKDVVAYSYVDRESGEIVTGVAYRQPRRRMGRFVRMR